MASKQHKPSSSVVSNAVSFGCVLAITISYTTNKSIIWAMIHGAFSWGYVIYHSITN